VSDPRTELEKLWGKALFGEQPDGEPLSSGEIANLFRLHKEKEQKEVEYLKAMYGDGGFDEYEGDEYA
jgi:arginine utilization protein RocB